MNNYRCPQSFVNNFTSRWGPASLRADRNMRFSDWRQGKLQQKAAVGLFNPGIRLDSENLKQCPAEFLFKILCCFVFLRDTVLVDWPNSTSHLRSAVSGKGGERATCRYRAPG